MRRIVSVTCAVWLAAPMLAIRFGAFAPATQPGATEALDGKWLGMVGFPEDRVAIGLEFKRDEHGGVRLLLTQPVMNFFGLEIPSSMKVEGEAITIEALGLVGALRNDTFEGTMTSLKEPFSMKRVETLPEEAPIPDLPRGPEPTWTTKLGAAIYAPVVVRDGTAYVGTIGGVFQAVNISDGSFIWVFPAGKPIYGEALVTDDAVYFVCDNGYLYHLNRATGEEVWRYDLGDAQVPRLLGHQHVFEYDCRASRPLLIDGTLYVGSGDGSVHAVNASACTRLWRFQTGGKIRADASTDGTRIFIGSLDHHLYALDRLTGEELWRKNTHGEITTAAPVLDGRVIVGSRSSALVSLDPVDGATGWKQIYWGSWVESEPILVDGLIYIGASDMRRAACYDPGDGRVVWRADVLGWTWGKPVVTGSRVYVGAAGVEPYLIRHVGGLLALDRATGEIAWRWPMPEAPGALHTGFAAGPAIEGDRLVIGGLDGVLYGFDVGER